MDDEEEILDWLTNPENMEMTDSIERANRKMFEKIRKASDYLAVFFCKIWNFFYSRGQSLFPTFLQFCILIVPPIWTLKIYSIFEKSDSDDCKQCPRVLAEIEHIDDEADGAGINFVKIDDKQMAKEVGVFALPAIVFYKQHSKEPVIYAGDLYDEEAILNWLLTQKNPGGDVIEDLEGQKLKKLIEESTSIAVYFCKFNDVIFKYFQENSTTFCRQTVDKNCKKDFTFLKNWVESRKLD